MTTQLLLVRDDLRIHDNPALSAACQGAGRVMAVYVHDEVSPGLRPLGAAAKLWLHHSVVALQESLAGLGIPLFVARGATTQVVADLHRVLPLARIHWSRRYEYAAREVDAALKSWARAHGVAAHSHEGFLLHEPWAISPANGPHYKVFSPFWKTLGTGPFREPLPAPQPQNQEPLPCPAGLSTDVASLGLVSDHPWTDSLMRHCRPGEANAHAALERFLESACRGYATGRDFPALPATSGLSPHLRFGELSPATVMAALMEQTPPTGDTLAFAREIGWREFCWHLSFHRQDLHEVEFRPEWAQFPWQEDTEGVTAWQQGRTGVPLVDAGMRQLWVTGTMHNRVRMVVASYLTKNLLVDWRVGEQWFWDTLVDADAAANPCNWQWVAGCGADAAPYFRIFNPLSQAAKFDPDGTYIRRWVPELTGVEPRLLHRGEDLGLSAPDYPPPLVDLAESRALALGAYQDFKALPRHNSKEGSTNW